MQDIKIRSARVNRTTPLADRSVPASWLVTLCEPLVDVATRAALEDAMAERCSHHPVWATWWFAGMISDQVATLPLDDPWRMLSARVSTPGPDLTRGISPRPPRHTGAVGRYGEFGTVRDGADLLPELPPNVSTDVGLAALGPGLSPLSAAVLAFCADDWQAGGRAAQALVEDGGELARSPERVFSVLAAALRWSIWRRRAYLSGEDSFTLASGFAWLWRAEVLDGGGALPAREMSEIEELRESSSLHQVSYSDVAMDTERNW